MNLQEVARMREYNDYVGMTKQYLKNYNQFKIIIDNLTEEIKTQRQIAAVDVAAPAAQYGDMPRGGTPELNSVESAAARHEKIQARIRRMETDIAALTRIISKVDRAISGLTEEDADIICAYYLKKQSWQQIARQRYMTEKWTRDRCNRAVKEMAKMIFGLVAMPPKQQLFVFAT